jgi:ParB family chromosome partitioning protein
LPSEKAFAYKMKLDSIKNQGVKSTCAPLVHKRGRTKSRDVIAGENNESAEQVRRYVRLTYLINEFLEMVDQNKIGFRTAVELSYLSKENQYYIYNYYEANEVIPSLSQAITLKSYENDKRLTQERLDEILEEEKPNQREKLWIVVSSIKHYFPKDYSSEQIDKVVKDLLKDYKASWQKDKSRLTKKMNQTKLNFIISGRQYF